MVFMIVTLVKTGEDNMDLALVHVKEQSQINPGYASLHRTDA
jgi:hypothetical protein